MVKAVFFDIDGTLVSFKTHQVPQSTIESISALRKKGIKVFIATGRHIGAINNVGDLEFDGYITLNGSYCLAGKDQVIYKHPIPAEDIQSMLHYQETVEPFPCSMAQENEVIMNYRDEAVDKVFSLLNFPPPPSRPLRESADKEVFQLIAFFTAEQEERIMSAMPNCVATRWNPLFSDVITKGISKSVGIDKIIEYYGIGLNETMAFGDGGNDVEMLRHAGIGVAMGGSAQEVIDAADYVTDTVDDNGIYNALKHYGVL